jgi:hypothetical protein
LESIEAKHQTVFIITVYSNEKKTPGIIMNREKRICKSKVRGSSSYTQAEWNETTKNLRTGVMQKNLIRGN